MKETKKKKEGHKKSCKIRGKYRAKKGKSNLAQAQL